MDSTPFSHNPFSRGTDASEKKKPVGRSSVQPAQHSKSHVKNDSNSTHNTP